jgi:copper resistance protein C
MKPVPAKRWFSAIFVLSLALLVPRLAFAHAHLLSSTPAAGATVHAGSIAIELRFNSRVDGQHSMLGIEIAGGGGEAAIIHDSQHGDSTLNAHADLKPGQYVIRWQALSTDGHITRGEIPFTVQ